MSTFDTRSTAVRRTNRRTESQRPPENGSIRQHDNHTNTTDFTLRNEDMERMKAELLRHVQSHLNDLLEQALSDSMQWLSKNTQTHLDHTIRFVMKSYSFIRETTPAVLKNTLQKGQSLQYPSLSSYLYFLFCPTLIYREVYPRNPYIRWNYVGMNFLKILASLFYLYFILVRLCIPVFRNKSNQPFSSRTFILALFHAAFPGMLMLMLGFYAFLHCWLNAFAEMLRFADRMFYKDWWNSTSFANYYRTWNIVVHDWLYYYGYRDFLWLTGNKLRSVATMSVFAVSALVHEYTFTLGFGFFYPVMFCTFAGIGVVFNFVVNDKRKSPVWNIMMWTCLFIGQGVHVCLYCLEWYAQIQCPRTGTSFWELVTPRSWTCSYQ
ncbi:sterol O-acyltransferase 2 [Garra rufa]|uniref:sterol O-acyltransferase 2 n=1 Tax=Garra rufa TaxID=137080 RepID=UPI003CCE9004